MKTMRFVLPVLTAGLCAGSATAATSYWEIDGDNTVPGTVANALIADGQGDDWTGAFLKIDLTSGSVYNDPGFDSLGTQANLWGFVPGLEWDSAVGIANDGSAGIAGGGGCGAFPCGPDIIGGTGAGAVSVTWFNTDTGNTGPVQIANITLTDDATGTWELITSFASGQVRTEGMVIVGEIVPEPASLAVMGLGGLAFFRRRR